MPWNHREGFEIKEVKRNKFKGLEIFIPYEDPPHPSKKTGLNMLVASTHGVLKTDFIINHRNVRVVINAFYPILNNKRCTTATSVKKNIDTPSTKVISEPVKKLLDQLEKTVGKSKRSNIRFQLRKLGHKGGASYNK